MQPEQDRTSKFSGVFDMAGGAWSSLPGCHAADPASRLAAG